MVWFLFIFVLWIGIIIGAYVALKDWHPKPAVFVDPVIWRVPFTDGEKQLEPEI